MGHNNKTMVSLKAGLSFAWIDKDLNEKLKEAIGKDNRVNFIKKSAKKQFGVSLESYNDLLKFDEIIKKNYYQDRADWLREICRDRIRRNK